MDRTSHTPLYVQLYDMIKQDIHSGKYAQGEHLPPERVLCEQLSVDRATVRKALEMLKSEGYIQRKQGKGTHVCSLQGNAPIARGGNILFALMRSAKRGDRISEPFYARSVDLFEQAIHREGYRMVYSVLHSTDDIDSLAKLFSAQGVVLAGTMEAEQEPTLSAVTVPVVSYNSHCRGISSVLVDNAGGAIAAAKHLMQLGHREIGVFAAPGFANSSSRVSAILHLLKEAGLPAPIIAQADWTEEGGYAAMLSLLQHSPRPTAVFAGNDVMALGALRALRDAGLRVPEDMSILGFDGIAEGQTANPPLTTLRVDIPAMVEATCMLLFHMMRRSSPLQLQTIVPVKLVQRSSTGPRNARINA